MAAMRGRVFRSIKLLYVEWWVRCAKTTAPFFDPSETPHRTERVEGIDIDEGIVGLLTVLWGADIDTVSSCQGEAQLDATMRRHMPNLAMGSRPYAASVGVVHLHDASAVIHAIAEASGGWEAGAVEASWGSEFVHVFFDPSLLNDAEFVKCVAQRLRSYVHVRPEVSEPD